MATLKEKIDAERRMRDLIDKEGMPEPDRVEYGHTCIRLFWEQPRAVVIVDIDPPPEGYEDDGEVAFVDAEQWLGKTRPERGESP
ncbi:MAG TPA: hypothetical protein VGL51_16055 [Solirubrobacteraceae bacterium]|jgi:hypothetical protein